MNEMRILVGSRMDVPQLAEQAIAEGRMDGVVIGRSSIADLDYANKVLMGKEEDVRPCLACNQGCIRRYLTCTKMGGMRMIGNSNFSVDAVADIFKNSVTDDPFMKFILSGKIEKKCPGDFF